MLERRWIRWLLALLGWTFVALFFASQTYLNYRSSGGRAPVGLILQMNLMEWYLWGVLALGIVWLARRVPLERSHWARSVVVHLGASVGFAFVEWWTNNFLRHHVLGFSQSVRLVYVFHQNLATYWIVVAATQGYLYYSRYRQGEVRAAQLSA